MSLPIEPVIQYLHALAVAVLLGKVVLLSFVVAPILAKNLEREPFGKVVRRLFPAYYALGDGRGCGGIVVCDRPRSHSCAQSFIAGLRRDVAGDPGD
ncbi:MAG: DUF4149 domain-containing protein [Nitrospira sp.]|nr:DUF4149 domain-containing protein [Nitrospira sp.]